MDTKDNIKKAEELINKIDKLQKTLDKTLNETPDKAPNKPPDNPPDNPDRPKREWIDKQEVMNILICSERTLQTLRDKGKLGYSKPTGGSKFFYRRSDVMTLFEKSFTVGI